MASPCSECGGNYWIGANKDRCAGCVILDNCTYPLRVDEKSCWIWTGARRNGFGIMKVDATRVVSANRVAYATWVEPVEPHWLVLQTCKDKSCCNPGHLRLGTSGARVGDAGVKRVRPGGVRVWGERATT